MTSGDSNRRRWWPWMLLAGGLGAGGCLDSTGGLGSGGSSGGDGPTGGADAATPDTGGTGGSGTADGTASGGGGEDIPPPGPPGGDACPELGCLPCGQGQACGEGTPVLEGTCCVAGDSLIDRAQGYGSEVVDIEVLGDLVVTCGGFGAVVEDVSDPTAPSVIAMAASRCQHAAFGSLQPDGSRVLYVAHHGDTWVQTPFLAAYRVDETGAVELQTLGDPDVLFEGLVWRDGWLYVAAHGRGLWVYSTDDEGLFTFEAAVNGFDNASRLALQGDYLYVGDGAGGLKVLSVADPSLPVHVGALPLPGIVRDVVVDGTQAYLAKGGDGIDVVDITDPAAPALEGLIETSGTAQAVEINEELVAIAAWSHVAVHDRQTGQLLATERTRPAPQFEQNLAIAMDGRMIHVGEWENHHVLEYFPGRVAPDIWVDQELVPFPAGEATDRVVVVRNRGYLDLFVDDIEVSSGFTADETWLQVPPQLGRAFEVSYAPPPPDGGQGWLRLHSDDPDITQTPTELPLIARDTGSLDVGDPLTSDFAFLDPGGAADLSGLEGNVIVLAYFALF